MHRHLHSQRQAENHVRLLCSLGLDWRALMPDLFRAIGAVVPFTHIALVWSNDDLQGLDGFSDWHSPCEEEVNRLLVTEFYQKKRMRELFKSGTELLKLPAISRTEQWLRISQRDFVRHDLYQQIIIPSQVHHHINLRLAFRNGLTAVLTMNRALGEPDFKQTEIKQLENLLPFLNFAISQPEVGNNSNWVDAEQGWLMFDQRGAVHYLDDNAEKIIDYATERRVQTRLDYTLHFRSPWLTEILKGLAIKLVTIRAGNANASPAMVRLNNRWGQFEFRGCWLDAKQPGEGLLYGANVFRLTPLPLKLANSLNHAPLSLRESQVALSMALGDTYSKIAEKLHISERTVVGHVQNIYQRLTVSNRAELLTNLLQRS